MNFDKLISRSFDLKLSFEQIYYLINGDYAVKDCAEVLTRHVQEKNISKENFVRLIKIMSHELA